MINQELIIKAAQMISESQYVVAFTGAGISAESGISTYRDKGGIWDKYPEGSSGGIMSVISNHPEDAPQILMGVFRSLKDAAPNPGHNALVELEKMGYLRSVITQNIDNLHREAGNKQVLELHGNALRLRCLECGKQQIYEREPYFRMMTGLISQTGPFSIQEMIKSLPLCKCGGHTRLDAVTFGEAVQDYPMAQKEAQACDMMLILGTSGVVYPAAAMPDYALSKGAKLIEINPKKSPFTKNCDIFLEGKTGELLPEIVIALKDILRC